MNATPAQQKSDELAEAIRHNTAWATAVILRQGANPNEKAQDGWYPLSRASLLGCEEIVRLLIEAGADTSNTTQAGEAPLTHAAAQGHAGIVRKLLDAGADIDAATEAGWTALMNAVYTGEIEVVRLLVDRGANVSLRDQVGNTAISIAKKWKDEKFMQILENSPSFRHHSAAKEKIHVTALERQQRLNGRAARPHIIRGPK